MMIYDCNNILCHPTAEMHLTSDGVKDTDAKTLALTVKAKVKVKDIQRKHESLC